MELLQLTYFCDAAETENFSKTAQRFTVPPSNISQSIKRLERELGADLFDRNANRITLNDRGRAFYRDARQALDLLESARRTAAGLPVTQQLEICIHAHRRIVMQAISRFQTLYPAVTIVTRHDIQSAHEADLVISDSELALPGFARRQLLREEMMLAARRDSFPKDVQQLAQRPFITMNHGSNLLVITQRLCRDLGFTPRIALQSEDPFYIRKCVELGLGVAFVPALTWRGQFSDQVELRKMGDYVREVCLYRRPESRVHQYAELFADILAEEFEKEARE